LGRCIQVKESTNPQKTRIKIATILYKIEARCVSIWKPWPLPAGASMNGQMPGEAAFSAIAGRALCSPERLQDAPMPDETLNGLLRQVLPKVGLAPKSYRERRRFVHHAPVWPQNISRIGTAERLLPAWEDRSQAPRGRGRVAGRSVRGRPLGHQCALGVGKADKRRGWCKRKAPSNAGAFEVDRISAGRQAIRVICSAEYCEMNSSAMPSWKWRTTRPRILPSVTMVPLAGRTSISTAAPDIDRSMIRQG